MQCYGLAHNRITTAKNVMLRTNLWPPRTWEWELLTPQGVLLPLPGQPGVIHAGGGGGEVNHAGQAVSVVWLSFMLVVLAYVKSPILDRLCHWLFGAP